MLLLCVRPVRVQGHVLIGVYRCQGDIKEFEPPLTFPVSPFLIEFHYGIVYTAFSL